RHHAKNQSEHEDTVNKPGSDEENKSVSGEKCGLTWLSVAERRRKRHEQKFSR
ncbi:hypothetical protein AMELA_G00058380, partial [Ameiurus melas]